MSERVAEEKLRLDKAVCEALPGLSRTRVAQHIQEQGVLVNGSRVTKPGYALRPGDRYEIPEIADRDPHTLEPVEMDLEVVYEDKHFLVVNKPRGLATHPASSLKEPSLVEGLLARGQPLSEGSAPWRPGIVHRLDKDTTGLIAIAKTDAAHKALAEQIEAKTMERRYFAWCEGKPAQEVWTVEARLGRDPRNPTRMAIIERGKMAITDFRLLEGGDESLVACRLRTGRTHQIRVHLQSIGYPVIGDPIYGKGGAPLQLHAAYLRLNHPATGEEMSLFCAPPEDFSQSVQCCAEMIGEWDQQTRP